MEKTMKDETLWMENKQKTSTPQAAVQGMIRL
jgi:hypothetical protein